MSDTYCSTARVLKVDEALGLVFGFGLITSEDGEDYFDTQGDHATDEAMLKAATEFMLSERTQGDMHEVEDGTVVFAFPLTAEVAKAFEVETRRTGLMIAVKPSGEVLEKFRTGEYTGFSIGGKRLLEEPVA